MKVDSLHGIYTTESNGKRMHDIYTRYTLGETVSIHFDYHLSIQFSYIRGVVGWVSVVYYESIKRELKRRLIYEYRCNERLKTKMILY